jgi:hypothetical protein
MEMVVVQPVVLRYVDGFRTAKLTVDDGFLGNSNGGNVFTAA